MLEKYVVLAAVDLNPGSTAVLRNALDLAATHRGSEIHIATVTEPEVPVVRPLAPGDRNAAEQTAQFCREYLASRLQTSPNEALPTLQVHAVAGWPADEIVWLAAHLDADVIVMGTQGRRGIKRLLLGSVAEKVVRLAGCPVWVVRDKAHDAPWRLPEIEPVCPDCAAKRALTNGERLWCDRHAEHHVRAHVLHYAPGGEDPPHAYSSSTGT